MRNGRRLAGNLLLALGSFLVALPVAEIILRWVSPPYWLYPLDPPEDALMIADPRLGYSLHPGKVEQWTRKDWTAHVVINAEGLRDEPLADARRADLRILSVGDSYTFGIGVEQRDTWSEVLETLLEERTHQSVAVVNAGVPGFNAKQMRLRAEGLLPQLEPSWVIFAMYARTFWRMQNPYAVFGGALVVSGDLQQLAIGPEGQLISSQFLPGPIQKLDVWTKSYFHLGARLMDRLVPHLWPDQVRRWPEQRVPRPVTVETYQPVLDEILALRQELTRDGIGLVILIVNHQEPDGSFDAIESECSRILLDFAARTGIPIVDPLPRLVEVAGGAPLMRYPDDQHWTPLAHRLVAEQLLDALDPRLTTNSLHPIGWPHS